MNLRSGDYVIDRAGCISTVFLAYADGHCYLQLLDGTYVDSVPVETLSPISPSLVDALYDLERRAAPKIDASLSLS